MTFKPVSRQERSVPDGAGAAPARATRPDGKDRLSGGGTGVQLRLLAMSDVHATLLPFDYFRDQPVDGQGLSLLARVIAEARGEVPGSVLLDNGDFLQGSILGDYLARSRTRMAHPVLDAYRALGVDAGTLGNHEFNFGLPFLETVLASASHPVVSANVARALGEEPLDDTLLRPPFALIERRLADRSGRLHRICVGVLGLTPPQITMWDRQNLDGRLQTRGMVQAARGWVPALRRAGADVVVILAHTGIGASPPRRGTDDEAQATALAALQGVDAVIAGHAHRSFPAPDAAPLDRVDPAGGKLAGKPAVMPAPMAAELGVIDLRLKPRAGGGWRVAGSRSELRRAVTGEAAAAPEAMALAREIEALAMPAHRATRHWVQRGIGAVTPVRLHSFFAMVADSPALWLVAEAQRRFVAASLSGTVDAGLPILSAVAPFRAGGRAGPQNFVDIPAGPLLLRHCADLCPFPNTVAAVRLSGADLRLWLERAFSAFQTVAENAVDLPLQDTRFASFHHERIFGLSFEVDLRQPAMFAPTGEAAEGGGRRITGLRRADGAVRDSDRFIVATTSFRAGGAGHFLSAGDAAQVLQSRTATRDVLARYLHDAPGGEMPPQSWRFVPTGGASVTIETAPGAVQCLADITALRPEPLGSTDTGFLRLRLRL